MMVIGATGDPGVIQWVIYGAILGAAALLSAGLSRWAGESSQRGWASPMKAVVWSVALALVVMLLASRGASLTLLVVLLSLVLGAVLALPILRDVLAAVVIQLEKTVRRGEVIEVAGMRGRVERFGVRRLVLRRSDGARLEVANGDVVAGPVVEGGAVEKSPCRCRVALKRRPEKGRPPWLEELEWVGACVPYASVSEEVRAYLEWEDERQRWSVVVEAYPIDEALRPRVEADLRLRVQRWMRRQSLAMGSGPGLTKGEGRKE